MEKKSAFEKCSMYMALTNAVLASITSITSLLGHDKTIDVKCAVNVGMGLIVLEIIILVVALCQLVAEDMAKKRASKKKAGTDAVCTDDVCK